MFKITPPIWRNVVKCGSVLLLAFLAFSAYFRGYQAGAHRPDEPVSLSKSFYYNPDSVAHYTALAAREDDPRALFIAGMATYLSYTDPGYPFFPPERGRVSAVTLPSLEEADHYLLLSAELGYPDAVALIRCLAAHDQWPHYIPANCR